MYLWMVLAAFLATLAAYILPLRNDMDKVLDNPIAEAMLMKLKVKHYTFEQMMHDYSCYEDSSKKTLHPDCVEDVEVFYQQGIYGSDAEIADTYGSEIDITNYAPYGFSLNNAYTSIIKCFCYDEENNVYSEQGNCNPICGEGESAVHGLLTYGPVPQHWLMSSPNGWTPSPDLLAAFRKNFASTVAAGIIIENADHSFSIQSYGELNNSGSEDQRFSIPGGFDIGHNTNCDNDNVCFGYLTWN